MDVRTRDGKPVIAVAMGDPAGISPELTAKVVALDEVRAAARLLVVGDRRLFDEGARIAGLKPDIKTVAPETVVAPDDRGPIFIDLANLDPRLEQLRRCHSARRRVCTRELPLCPWLGA